MTTINPTANLITQLLLPSILPKLLLYNTPSDGSIYFVVDKSASSLCFSFLTFKPNGPAPLITIFFFSPTPFGNTIATSFIFTLPPFKHPLLTNRLPKSTYFLALLLFWWRWRCEKQERERMSDHLDVSRILLSSSGISRMPEWWEILEPSSTTVFYSSRTCRWS